MPRPSKAKLEQTKLNVDTAVLDVLTTNVATMLGKAMAATDKKLDILLEAGGNNEAMMKVTPGQLASMLDRLMNSYVLLAGSSTRTLEFDKDEVAELKEAVALGEEALDTALQKISEKIVERKKRMLALVAGPELEEGVEGPEGGESGSQATDFEAMQIDIMRRKGYLDEAGQWTGKVPDASEPIFIRNRLERMNREP